MPKCSPLKDGQPLDLPVSLLPLPSFWIHLSRSIILSLKDGQWDVFVVADLGTGA